jgi:hypothetical protein
MTVRYIYDQRIKPKKTKLDILNAWLGAIAFVLLILTFILAFYGIIQL